MPTHYGATYFVAALARFIVLYNNPHLSARDAEEKAMDIHLPFNTLSVFHRIKFWNEEVHGNETLDSIHVQPPNISADRTTTKSGRFDTALVQVKHFGRSDLGAGLEGMH
ncbi:hypothetical protein BJ138DRAFT_1018597 [Hygrophoropsis aurantiaca]|uniref:Uncharacterized protein n=1 Tax=Hygrophoropsis aurantiaca TaxID=72124 RepID=A0ACB7ZVB9_9AGAM|nr:hypothetical protein BJ138DRAFT_1018597 [Hygrophoropsis aurantiaca]